MWLKLRKKLTRYIGVARVFDWGVGKPQMNRSDVIKFFWKEGLFTGQRHRRMEDQKMGPVLASNLGFATEKGLEPKVEKISKIGWRGEQTSLIQTYHRRVFGGRRWAIFCNFFLENE